jgi:hypothetical protein
MSIKYNIQLNLFPRKRLSNNETFFPLLSMYMFLKYNAKYPFFSVRCKKWIEWKSIYTFFLSTYIYYDFRGFEKDKLEAKNTNFAIRVKKVLKNGSEVHFSKPTSKLHRCLVKHYYSLLQNYEFLPSLQSSICYKLN